jgi:hypothetical protein
MEVLPQSLQRISFERFSIAPPQGDHWCIQHLDKKIGVAFGTSPLIGQTLTAIPPAEDQSHTLGAMAMVVDLENAVTENAELREFVVQWLRAGQPSRVQDGRQVLIVSSSATKRFKLIDSKVAVDTSAGCIRYDATFEERDNPRLPGEVLVLMERGNLLCRVPDSKTPAFVLIGASERYSQAHEPSWKYFNTSQTELDAFARSLEFSEPP